MDRDDALEQFENWYNSCIENGINPEEVVSSVGEMILITDIAIIKKIIDLGII